MSGIQAVGRLMANLARANRLLFDWADWAKAGKTCAGMFQTSQWPTGRPPNRQGMHSSGATRRKRHSPTLPVPHETRTTRLCTPCMPRHYPYLEERVHGIIVRLPDSVKHVIACLYLHGMGYADTAVVLQLTSKKIARIKFKTLQVIDSLL